jgi:uncharacterized membrane protein (DUF2068 family)
MAMSSAIWVNPRQPQTLYIGQILMYIRGVMALLFGGAIRSIGHSELFGSKLLATVYLLLLTVGLIAGAFGIANEKRWGYRLGVVAAFAPLVVTAYILLPDDIAALFTHGDVFISVVFDVALVALLLHDSSREYQRIWFR